MTSYQATKTATQFRARGFCVYVKKGIVHVYVRETWIVLRSIAEAQALLAQLVD